MFVSGVGSRTLHLLGVAERFVTGWGCSGLLVAWTSGAVGFWRREWGSLVCFLLGVVLALLVLLCVAVSGLDYGIIDIVN